MSKLLLLECQLPQKIFDTIENLAEFTKTKTYFILLEKINQELNKIVLRCHFSK
jgi:hypothetical protein